MKLIINKSINEERLINGCKEQNPGAQRDLYERYSPVFYGLCLRYLKDTAEAEDVMIQAFMKIFKKISQFKAEGSFEGWMRRIMVNESLSYLRKNKSMHLEVDIEKADKTLNYDIFESSLEAEDLMSMVKRLPDGYRTVFNLYAIEGYSHKEIAEMLEINENTSKSQLSRARKLLQKYLASTESVNDKSVSNE